MVGETNNKDGTPCLVPSTYVMKQNLGYLQNILFVTIELYVFYISPRYNINGISELRMREDFL